MAADSSAGQDLIARLQRYQEVSNSYDIGAAVAMFTEDGMIEANGKQYSGQDVLRAAHEYDMASGTQVAFSDFVVQGDVVTCTFVTCDELDRIVGTGGMHTRAEFTFSDGRIRKFRSLPPEAQEVERHRQAKGRFFAWAREHYPEEVAKGFNFDYETGASLFKVARAWHDHHQARDSNK